MKFKKVMFSPPCVHVSISLIKILKQLMDFYETFCEFSPSEYLQEVDFEGIL